MRLDEEVLMDFFREYISVSVSHPPVLDPLLIYYLNSYYGYVIWYEKLYGSNSAKSNTCHPSAVLNQKATQKQLTQSNFFTFIFK